ncbi:MAG: ATP-binding cassette domain-containing protein [Polyangiaceae bacterium]|nr:ATP-binding cassette domain-containing protein [Polyangiaceae bacterium]
MSARSSKRPLRTFPTERRTSPAGGSTVPPRRGGPEPAPARARESRTLPHRAQRGAPSGFRCWQDGQRMIPGSLSRIPESGARMGRPGGPAPASCSVGGPALAGGGCLTYRRSQRASTMGGDSREYIIGAAVDCAIQLAQSDVSAHHARLIHTAEGFLLEDLGSSNGTYVDGQRIGVARLLPTSRIQLASVTLSLQDLLGAIHPSTLGGHEEGGPRHTGPPTPQGPVEEFVVGHRMLLIGRDPRADVSIPEPRVSHRHARVFRNAGRLIVEDAGSANGTFVNGERIAWKVLTADDIAQIGSRQLRFVRAPRTVVESPPARVDVRNVTIDVLDRNTRQPLRIVDDVSFTVFPGEVVAIMGPSGSGKTTLLMALAGLGRPSQGSVEINGRSLYGAGGVLTPGFSALVGYAPQDDVVHELLTVEEAVRYSAQLRCAPSVSRAEIERRVTRALRDVGLEQKRRTRIGSVTSKSLSGGQRKRVNIAMELVTDPPVLLLDEPTSGLSSKDAADLVDLLRRLADGGRTILLTLHQPSYPMFVEIDQLVLLEQGRLAYFGPTAVDSFEFFQVKDHQAGALLDEIPVEGPPVWPLRFRDSETFRRAVVARQLLPVDPTAAPAPPRSRGPIANLFTLLRRGLLLKARDKYFWVVAVVVPLLVAALFSIVLGSQLGGDGCSTTEEHTRAEVEHSYLVVLTIMACFFGALSSALEVLRERDVLERERRSGVSILSYLASKAFLFVIPALTHPLASLMVLHLFGGALEGSFFLHYIVLVPAFFAATTAGLCISASVGSAEGVIGLAVSYAIVQTVFSAFAPLSVTVGDDARHTYLRWAAAPVTARWTLSGLVAQSDLCRPIAREGTNDAEERDDRTQRRELRRELPTTPTGTTVIMPDAPPPTLVYGDAGDAPLLQPMPAPAPAPMAPAAPPAVPDRCEPEPGCDDEACLRDDFFVERCEQRFYEDHGIPDASTAADRTGPSHLLASVAVNSFLACLALLGAGLLLRRRSQ